MISAIHKRLQEREEGFTLIELLVVVIIIGILAAIAIPVFLNQRERAWERATMSDIRNSAVVMEEVFSADGSYLAAQTASPYAGGDEGAGHPIVVSDGTQTLTVSRFVTLTVTGDGDGYTVTGEHQNLPGRSWTLDSAVGSPIENAPAAP